jgi:hypothetical protein
MMWDATYVGSDCIFCALLGLGRERCRCIKAIAYPFITLNYCLFVSVYTRRRSVLTVQDEEWRKKGLKGEIPIQKTCQC